MFSPRLDVLAVQMVVMNMLQIAALI